MLLLAAHRKRKLLRTPTSLKYSMPPRKPSLRSEPLFFHALKTNCGFSTMGLQRKMEQGPPFMSLLVGPNGLQAFSSANCRAADSPGFPVTLKHSQSLLLRSTLDHSSSSPTKKLAYWPIAIRMYKLLKSYAEENSQLVPTSPHSCHQSVITRHQSTTLQALIIDPQISPARMPLIMTIPTVKVVHLLSGRKTV